MKEVKNAMRPAAAFLAVMSVAVLLVSSVLYLTQDELAFVGDTSFVIVSFTAAAILWITSRSIIFPDERKVWTLLAVASTFDFIAEAYWAYAEIFQGIELPSPSIADAFWIASYLLFIWAVWSQLQMLFEPTKKLVAALSTGFAALLLLGYLFVRTIAMEGMSFSTIIDFSYPFFDIIEITLAILVLLPLLRVPTKLSKPWLLLCISYLIFFIYDFTYAYLRVFAEYYTGATVDILYILGYVIFGLAGYAKLTAMEAHHGTKPVRSN